ncbi:MAG: ribosome assembly RNA-binding protein YhbY [Clostridia bacterium]|nr:ribosome assembly RNA-binding protein YhbY [Clostridia bacterium]MDY5264643.1 ribosome assembly RNA-binding protein YhbY [Eubacteriales bacterium]MDY5439433.1 ribosome assembly RNA-binding protein YhbY [Eubacteriales bacterium]
MLNSKQRSNLRGKAMVIETIFQVGKGGVSDNMVADIKKALDARELIKITVLKNNDETPMDVLQDLAMKLSAEPVCAIGNKIVLYKKSTRKDIEHVKF